ncbi:MAG: hypothetical protein Q8L46_01705 [candidate division WWE3 bacterium]|nr:hypothetical protein [candidate division WWE3 bacterium]
MSPFLSWFAVGALVAVAIALHLYGWGFLAGYVANRTNRPAVGFVVGALGAVAGIAVTVLVVIFWIAFLCWKFVLRHIFWLGRKIWEIGCESAP